MAMTLMIENINNDISLYSSEKPGTSLGGSYYKFYQLKLRQLVTQTRYRKEQDARIARQKLAKNPPVNNCLTQQRIHKEYMNYIRDKAKNSTQEIPTNKSDEQKKRCESVLSYSNRTITLSMTPTNLSAPLESRPKAIVKTKQTSAPPKQQRVISAPISRGKNVNQPKIIPKIQIDGVDETLSKADIHSFTQVTSSSRNTHNKKHQHARQSILDTIMLHLDSHQPSNVSKLPTYDDIANKFSSSYAPTVYRDFERIVV